MMLIRTEKERLTAKWIGECLREISVLIVVFIPLDWFLGRNGHVTVVSLATLTAAAAIFSIGVMYGFRGEFKSAEAEEEIENG